MRFKIFSLVSIFCLLQILAGNILWAANFNNVVATDAGKVEGIYDERYHNVKWLGIPYAAVADGKNRWKNLQPAPAYDGVKICDKYAPANIQFNGKQVIGKEGILTLDIYRPDTKERNLPVIVFVHGGNNQTSNSRLWIGDKFAAEANAVYVSVQYRLGVLGFNNLSALHSGDKLADSGNYGLLDQAFALDWIKRNIAGFGGNPHNITVSGFSAGGRDVMAMLISPVFKDKFNKAISFSGGLTVADYKESQQILAENLAPLAVEDGLFTDTDAAARWLLSDAEDVREYLNKLPAERLAPVMAGAVIRMKSFPHLYADGYVLPAQGFDVKKMNSVPLLMLASADEFSSFVSRDPYFKNRLAKIQPGTYDGQEFAFANKYGSKLYGYFNGQEAAQKIYDHYDNDIYVCKFEFAHNPAVSGEQYALKTGAVHGIFLPFITDQPYPYTQNTDIFQTVGAQELSKVFTASLASFIRTGNPNNELLPQHWDKWNKKNRAEMVFDADKNSALVYLRHDATSYDNVLQEMEADSSIKEDDKQYIMHYVLNGRWFSQKLDAKYHNQ